MADITVDEHPYLYEISNVEKSVALNIQRLYVVYHTGKQADGAAATEDVFLQTDGAATDADFSNLEGKIPLQAGDALPLPSGVAEIKMITASGAVCVLFMAGEKARGHIRT